MFRHFVLAWMGIWGTCVPLGSTARTEESASRVRVGVYDNRAIAVAFAASKFNPVAEKLKAYNAAKEAGNAQQMRELEAWGQETQRQLHRQGFGRVPVDDLLAHVQDRLPEVAQQAGLHVIVWQCDFAGPEVEIVDVTDALVRLFDPSEKTLRIVADLQTKPPVDLDTIEKSHAH